jgi:hypothetical protein
MSLSCVVAACVAIVFTRGCNLQWRRNDNWLELTVEPTSVLAFVRQIRNFGAMMHDVGRIPPQT